MEGNIMYGKIIDGQLEIAPDNVIYNNVKYMPAPTQILVKMGYKPIEYTPSPESDGDYHYEHHFEETDDKIIEVWERVEDTPEEICARLRQYLTDTDKYYIQFSEGDKTKEEYEPYRIARQEAREHIRELEN